MNTEVEWLGGMLPEFLWSPWVGLCCDGAVSNLDAILEKAGMNRHNIVSLRFFTTDIDGFLENYDIYANDRRFTAAC